MKKKREANEHPGHLMVRLIENNFEENLQLRTHTSTKYDHIHIQFCCDLEHITIASRQIVKHRRANPCALAGDTIEM